MRVSLITALCLFCFTVSMSAQWHGDGVQKSESYISVTGLPHIPELHTDMSLDCFIGYVAMDSIARTGSIQDVQTAARQMTIPELRALARFVYGMQDYNPILLNRHFMSTMDSSYPNKQYQSYYANSYYSIIMGVHDRKEEFGRDYALLVLADYVLHIHVLDVRSGTDSVTFSPDKYPWTNVACNVEEIFKGHYLPNNCAPITHPMQKENKQELAAALPCLIYGHMTNSGSQYIPQPGDEMIVFLTLVLDKEGKYKVYPVFGMNATNGRFIVRNGRIDDPDNTWGLGVNPTVEDFRTSLLKKINDVRTWTR